MSHEGQIDVRRDGHKTLLVTRLVSEQEVIRVPGERVHHPGEICLVRLRNRGEDVLEEVWKF